MQEGKKPVKREITYQVGWKRGRMEIGENGKVTGSHTGLVVLDRRFWARIVSRTALRPVHPLSDKTVAVWLWTVPPAAFVLIWGLVLMLGR